MRSLLHLAVLAVLFGLTACNPVDEENGGATTGTTATGTGAGNGAAVAAKPVKLGFNLEQTGNAATFGISAMHGAEIAIDELNEAGGLLGHPIEAVYDDNQSMPQPAANVASKLINQDKVDVLIGAVGSSQSIAMAKVADEAGIPMVTPASTNPSVTLTDEGQVRKYVFRTCFTDDFQGEGIVDFAVNGPIQAKRAVVFYDAENDYSVGIYETVKRVAPAKGLEIVAEDAYLGQSETDFRSKLNKFKAHEFDALIVPGYYNQVGMIANQAREVGLDQPLLGGDGFDSPELYRVAGPNIVGSYFTNHYAADDMDPAVQGYITKYKEYHGGKIPDAMSILTYDAVKVVASVIKKLGNTDPDAIAAELAKVSGFKGAAGAITIDEKHNATKKLVVLRIGDGGKFEWTYTYDPLAGNAAIPAQAETPAEDETADAAAEGDTAEVDEAEEAADGMNESAEDLEST